MKPRLLHPAYFVWVLVPLILYGAYLLKGLPHFIWEYDFHGSRSDWSQRTYTRCTFVGPYGQFTTYPTDGHCPWFAFFKQKEAGH